MPHFKVIILGQGIDCSVGDDRAIGFFTTRLVRASDHAAAEAKAKALVLSEWQPGGAYAGVNRGSLPVLAVDRSFTVGLFVGIFGRKRLGYAFYSHED